MKPLIALLTLSAALYGCGNSFSCAIYGDNLRGHISYETTVSPQATDRVVVQASADGFTTVSDTSTIENMQALPTVPYKMCVDNDTNLTIRAFVDRNTSYAWEAGEPAGRMDNTSGSNGTFKTFNIPSNSSSAQKEWEIVDSVNFALDNTAAQ
ncbi:MAG: hypothetical protein JNL01_08995 [Bdellovibrionales bacterium]|nr:hypothetical protein [Bdellovibrionales bacterium]